MDAIYSPKIGYFQASCEKIFMTSVLRVLPYLPATMQDCWLISNFGLTFVARVPSTIHSLQLCQRVSGPFSTGFMVVKGAYQKVLSIMVMDFK